MSKKDFEYDLLIHLVSGDDIIGGYNIDWKVEWDKLADADEIVFHVLDNGVSAEQNYEFLLNLSINSDKIPEPEIK